VSFYVYVRVRSPRRWKGVKRTLRFLCVTQDGDDEGIFVLRAMPTSEQAVNIRKVLGLRKAPVLTDEQRACRRLNLAPRNGAVSSDFTDVIGATAVTLQTNLKPKKLNELMSATRAKAKS
jgi:hypothetical protein